MFAAYQPFVGLVSRKYDSSVTAAARYFLAALLVASADWLNSNQLHRFVVTKIAKSSFTGDHERAVRHACE